MSARKLESWLRLFVALVAASWLIPAWGAATFSLPSAPDAKVLHYSQRAAMIAGDHRPFSVTVYADGRVDVHRPRYFKQSGDYRMWLTPARLDDLVAAVVADGLVAFDGDAVEREIQQRRLAKLKSGAAAPFSTVSDDERTTLEIHLASYAPKPGAKLVRDVHRRIRWTNLAHQADSNPRIQSLQGLLSVADRLRELGRAATKQGFPDAPRRPPETRGVQ